MKPYLKTSGENQHSRFIQLMYVEGRRRVVASTLLE